MEPRNIEAETHQEDGASNRENRTSSWRFPPGFRFKPEDDELIVYYLNRKINGRPMLYDVFNEVNLYDYDPETLYEMFELPGQDRLYFFTPRSRKYPNGSRPARAAGGGYWKATGSEKKIYWNHYLVGVKKTLVYYKGKAKKTDGVKTDWTMQEYISEITTCKPGDSMKLDDCVLCCVHKKRGAVDNPNKLLQVSPALSDMPTKQVANDNQSYQTFIDSSVGYGNAIMEQRLVAAPSEQITEFNGMVQPSLIAPSEQMIDLIDSNDDYGNATIGQLVAPSEQMIDFNDMVQPSAPSDEQMIDFSRMAQPLAEEPSAQMTDFNEMVQPLAVMNDLIELNDGYGNATMGQQLAVAPSEQIIEYNGMVQPSAPSDEQMIDFSKMALPLAAGPSEQMTDFNEMEQPLAVPYGEPMANYCCIVQNTAMSPIMPLTNFNGMVQPFAAAPIKPMTSFKDRSPLFEIADFNAMGQPSPSALITEHNGIMSIHNNHSTREDFQQNSSNAMTCVKDYVDRFGMACGDTNEVIDPSLIYPSIELPYHQPETGIDNMLGDTTKPKELDADNYRRYDAGSKHDEDYTRPNP